MERLGWGRLNHLQLVRYAQYLVKMEFTLWGFSVFTADVDDRGVDFVARTNTGSHFDVQVKSILGLNYISFPKKLFPLDRAMLAAVAVFIEGHRPDLYLIPSRAWRNQDVLFLDREHEGLKSEPEWGLNLSHQNLPLLEPYVFAKTIKTLGG